jgi:hypothetical protein
MNVLRAHSLAAPLEVFLYPPSLLKMPSLATKSGSNDAPERD